MESELVQVDFGFFLQTWTMWMKSLGEFWSAKMRSGVIEEFWRI